MMRPCCFALFLAVSRVAASDGMFADFTTSLGNFTVELDAVEAPRTVANFVSLAEGSRPWVDPLTGALHANRPYYDGVTFHRVIADFVSQSGSRNGLGTDGPGYRFRDEISLNLTHQRHVISMANSGVNTNGAQFFITDVVSSHLNGVHSVFGRVVDGGNVVDAINAVPKDVNNRPLTPVVIQTVNIRRVGAAAEAFDVMAWSLPVVSPLPGTLEATPGGPILYRIQPEVGRTVTQAHRSLDLASWTSVFLRNEFQNNIDLSTLSLGTASTDRAFFNISQVHYPDALPNNLASRVLDVRFNGNQRLLFTVNSNGQTGTCQYTNSRSTTTHSITAISTQNHNIFNTSYTLAAGSLGTFQISILLNSDEASQFAGSATVRQNGGTISSSGIFTLTK